MSLKTRINGFTAWTNLRLTVYDSHLNNVLYDLTKGFHLQQLLHSLSAKSIKKLQTLDGLTQQQKATRVEWMVQELKKSDIIPDDVKINYRLVAAKSADHVFDLLWRLVAHDIWFTWERMEFLQQNDDKLLSSIPFRWTPNPPPKKKKRRVIRTAESMMGGFGSSSQSFEDPTPSPTEPEGEGYDKYPGADDMKAAKPHLPRGGWYSYPSPDDCIIDMINSQLQTVSEGKKFTVYSLDDLIDSQALCGLINSFVPGSFTTEVMLNDRWTINLVLRTVEKMLHASNPMGAEDLSEADPKSICAYMCFFFMSCFKLKQSTAAINRLKELTLLIQEGKTELEGFPEEIVNMQDLKRKKKVEETLEDNLAEQEMLRDAYDVEYVNEWLQHIRRVQKETRKTIADKMFERFDLVTVPRSMTINDLCMATAINLQLTQGQGFYHSTSKETCTADRRIILRDKKTKVFLDDFTGAPGCCNIRELLDLPRDQVVAIDPRLYPQYDFYFESMSRNKMLKGGSIFLYQVFPGHTWKWQRMFFKAVRDGDLDVVKKMVVFFRHSHPQFIFSKDGLAQNGVLHVAARFGHFEISKYLLENGCNPNSKNNTGSTPLFFAAEGLHKRVAQLLIEWGCDTQIQNCKCEKAFDLMRHEEMRESLTATASMWTSAGPLVVRGRQEPLMRIARDHLLGIREMVDPSARCVKGSTLLHTAAHFSHLDTLQVLLKIRVDINIQDYQGATPLHRAKTLPVLQFILDSNAEVNAIDNEGNTALHARCYGEDNKPSFVEGVSLLISYGADVIRRNERKLMPIHCAAMQGRRDVIELMLKDHGDTIKPEIDKEFSDEPPSLPFLAVAENFTECAKWLVLEGFRFKEGECDQILYKILTQQIDLSDRADTTSFLLDNGGSVGLRYVGGDTAAHLAARMTGPIDVLEVLIERGAKIDTPNDDGSTPLFDTFQLNNFVAAKLLIDQGADIKQTNNLGLTCLDYVFDYEEWIESPYFSDDVIARLKAFRLKHTRDMIRAITKKLQHDAHKRKMLYKQAKLFASHEVSSKSLVERNAASIRHQPLFSSLLPARSRVHITDNKRLNSSITLPVYRRIEDTDDNSQQRRLTLPPLSFPQAVSGL